MNKMKATPIKALLFIVGAGLLTAGLVISFQRHSLTSYTPLVGDPIPAAATSAPVGIGSSFEKPDKPVRLIIPAIGVDAAVQSVGLAWQGNGDMGIPTNFTDVGWYDLGPRPGMPGNAVIDGHLDGRYVAKAVFYDLGKLQPGDLVKVVDQAGATFQFRVVGSKSYAYNATTTAIFAGDVSKARLNLITCGGTWVKSQQIYDQRIVVFTELAPPDPS